MTKLIRNKKFTRITALLLAVAVIFGTMFALPAKSFARFLQTEKKPIALNPVIHSTQAIR